MEKWKEFQDQSQLVSLGLCSPQPTAFHKHSDENPVKSHLVWQLMYNYTLSQFIFIKGSLIYNIHLEILVFITFYCLCQKATCLLITLPATYCKNNFKKFLKNPIVSKNYFINITKDTFVLIIGNAKGFRGFMPGRGLKTKYSPNCVFKRDWFQDAQGNQNPRTLKSHIKWCQICIEPMTSSYIL